MDARAAKQKAPPLGTGCHFHMFGPLDRSRLAQGGPIRLPKRRFRAPERCVLGADWPHSQMSPPPEAGPLLDQFFEWVPDAALRQKILADNPEWLYGF